MTYKNTCRSWRKHHFTIVELIIVMIIMTIMLSMTLPSFTQLGKGYKLAQAAQEVIGQVSIAKAYAVANHCYVAVVFPTEQEIKGLRGSDAAKNASPIPGYYNASCRIAIVTKSNAKRYEFVMWKPDSNWVLLPENTVISDEKEHFGEMQNSLKDVRLGDLVKLYTAKPSESDLAETCDLSRFLIITPDGQIATDDQNTSAAKIQTDDTDDTRKVVRICLTEGSYNRSQKKIILFERNKGTQIYQHIEFDPLTARAAYQEFE